MLLSNRFSLILPVDIGLGPSLYQTALEIGNRLGRGRKISTLLLMMDRKIHASVLGPDSCSSKSLTDVLLALSSESESNDSVMEGTDAVLQILRTGWGGFTPNEVNFSVLYALVAYGILCPFMCCMSGFLPWS